MNRRNKLFVILLTTALLFCFFTQTALAASANCCEVAVGGVENYTEAFDVLTLVNELRESLGVQALTMDETLMDYAMQRAAELALLFSHTRPDGTAALDGCYMAYGENIAYGSYTMSTAEEAYTAWYNSTGHYENMVRESFNSIGIGMFQIAQDYYWVQVFGYDGGSNVQLSHYAEEDGKYNQTTVIVLDDLLKETTTPVPEATELQTGDKIYIDLKTEMLYSAYLDPTGFIFESSDESVCTVDEYGIVTAIGPGTATVTVSSPGLDDPWTIDFTVCSGHEYDEGVVTVEPGCNWNDYGKKVYTCLHCGASYTERLYGGTCAYDDGVVTKEATCGANGILTYTCTRCGNTVESTIPATGEHTYNDGVVTEEPTCKDWGTLTYTCTGCGSTKEESIRPHDNHTYGDGEITREPDCTYQGFIHYSCVVCNAGYIETLDPLGHAWDDGVITTQPTCTQQGWLTYTCSRCHATTMEDMGFSSMHKWDEGTVIRQPSLLQSGEIKYKCTLCTATKTEPLDLPAGDVNGSNQVDATDVVVLMKHVLGDSTPVNEKALDVNGDDRTDILDVIRLIRWLADKSIILN